MPRLVSPPINPIRPCGTGPAKGPAPLRHLTSRKRKTAADSQGFYVKTSSPSKSPLHERHFQLTSPPKKKRATFTPVTPDLTKGVVRNLRPLLKTAVGVEDVKTICRSLMQDAKEVMENGTPKFTAEQIFQMVEQVRIRGKEDSGDCVKHLLHSLEDVVVQYLKGKLLDHANKEKKNGILAFFSEEWCLFTRKSTLLCSLFSPLIVSVSDDSAASLRTAKSPSLKEMLNNVFSRQLNVSEEEIFNETSLRLKNLRDLGCLEVPKEILTLREMLLQVNCQMYQKLGLFLRNAMQTDYSMKLESCLHMTPLEFLHFTIKMIAYEEEIAEKVLSASLACEFRQILTSLAAEHFTKISPNLWQCSWEDFSEFTEKSKLFLHDRSLSPVLLNFFRLYWMGKLRPILEVCGGDEEAPEKLVACMGVFEAWCTDLRGVSAKIADLVGSVLGEAVKGHLPATADLQALMGTFAELVASHAWDERFFGDLREVAFIVEFLKLFRELEAFESSLRWVTVNYFTQNKPPDDFHTAYISQLQTSLTACFSVDWTAFNSILVELHLSQALSSQFHALQLESQPPGKGDNLSVSLLKSSTVAHCFTPCPLNLPPEIAASLQDFHAFYTSQAKKKLTFLSGLGSCTLIGRGLSPGGGAITVKATLPQGVILLAFNDAEELSLAELRIHTGLVERDLVNVLVTLEGLVGPLEERLAAGSQEELKYAVKTAGKCRRMNLLPGFNRKNSSVEISAVKGAVPAALLDRKQQIDAITVHVMKHRKSLSFTDLLAQVQLKMPTTKDEDLQARVASLVERQFLGWKGSDETILDYLP